MPTDPSGRPALDHAAPGGLEVPPSWGHWGSRSAARWATRPAPRLAMLVALLTWVGRPTQAHACTEPPCQNGFLVPSGSARVPANAPGFWWRAARDGLEPPDAPVSVRRLPAVARGIVDGIPDEPPAGSLEPETLTVTRTPVRSVADASGAWSAPGVLLGVPLSAGDVLAVEAADACAIGGQRPFTATVQVTPAQPLPRALGTLRASPPVHGPLTVASEGGGCSRETDAVYVDVALTLDTLAQPWADLLLYETHVDGQRYAPSTSSIHTPAPHESWLGRGRERLFVDCSPGGPPHGAVGLTPGEHAVQLLGRLPGRDEAILSDTLRVSLTCPGGSPNPGEALYDVVSFQVGAVVVAAQLALLLYIVLTRRRRSRSRDT